jgi:Fe-coproporphyrin III synthase
MNGCVIATFRCNAGCHMCDIWRHPSDPADELPPRFYERLPSGLGRINLTGGEPMMRDDIEDIVEILSRKCRLVEISTNGFYTDRILAVAHRFPNIMVRVSLEGLPALNDRQRGTRDGFDHALRTMLGLMESPVKDIGFSVVVTDRNAGDLVVLYRLCAALGVELGNAVMHNSWYFHKTDDENKVLDVPRAAGAEQQLITALLRSRRRQLRMRAKDYARAYFNLNILNHLEGKPNVLSSCAAGRDLFFVDPWGNVTPCNGSAEPWIMGNLKEQSFAQIWDSPKAQEMRTLVDCCDRSCALIQIARFDMMRHPARPLKWIVRNKLRLSRGLPVDFTP